MIRDLVLKELTKTDQRLLVKLVVTVDDRLEIFELYEGAEKLSHLPVIDAAIIKTNSIDLAL